MINVTISRIKKAFLNPKAAFRYLFNYLEGDLIKFQIKFHLIKVKIKTKEVLNSDFHFFADGHNFLEEIANQDFIIPSANRILSNEFGFLGINPKILKEINWQQDIKSGHIWPNDFYLDLREKLSKDYNKGWDIKNVWELSRFHYLIPLALAYYQTGEEKYLNKWQELINDWIENNPVYYGPNWINAMEVAIRACNWILSFEIINAKLITYNLKLEEDFLGKFLTSLYEHGRFIYSNLEYAPIRSNHYVSDLVGLTYLGLFFKKYKEAQKWLNYAVKSLEKEMDYQVYDDGVDYELSISYHRYKTELFLFAAYVLKNNKINLSHKFWLKLNKMMDFILAVIKPNGLAPQIGDSDDSRLHLIWEDYFSWEKRNYDALIKLFNLVTEKQEENYPFNSVFFPQGGFYILKNNNFYLITGRGQACYGKGGGHTHNDLLSFELSLFDEDIIIDPGTYVYSPEIKERNKFRSTQAHNTVMINHQEQSPLSQDPFYFEQKAQLKIKKYEEQKDFIVVEGVLGMYQRKFFWDKKIKSLSIIDKFEGQGKHILEWNFHLAPKIKVWLKKEANEKRGVILMSNKHSFLLIGPQELNCAIIDDEVSPSYGVKVSSKTIRFSGFLDKDTKKDFEFKIEPIK